VPAPFLGAGTFVFAAVRRGGTEKHDSSCGGSLKGQSLDGFEDLFGNVEVRVDVLDVVVLFELVHQAQQLLRG
jgi:hypothetical protein